MQKLDLVGIGLQWQAKSLRTKAVMMTFYRIFLGKADMQMIDKDGSGYSKKTINTGIKFLGNALSLAQKC